MGCLTKSATSIWGEIKARLSGVGLLLCLITYVDFVYYSNIKMALSDP
jgi:hypothetical protein